MSSNDNVEVNLLKAKLEAQRKDKTIYFLVGLFAGLIVGFFVTNHLNTKGTGLANSTPAGATQLPSGNLPADHPPVEGGQAGAGGMQPVVREAIQKAKDNPDDFDAQMRAAAMYYQIQMYDKALEFLERANKIKPDNYDSVLALANVTYDAGKYAEAVPLYERAIQMKPEDANVRTELGSTYHSIGEEEKAVAEFRRALTYDPKNERALHNLAHVLLEKGDARGAEDAITKLNEANPQYQGLAKLRTDLNDLKTKGKIPTH